MDEIDEIIKEVEKELEEETIKENLESNYIAISNIVLDKRQDFFDKYKRNPKYIKMPFFYLRFLQNYFKNYEHYFEEKNNGKTNYFYGMQICETPTIENAKEIEVF